MIKQLLLWILKDEIIRIAEHEAQKIVGVFYSVRGASRTNDPVETDKLDLFTQANPGFHAFIDKVFLKKGDKRIFINDFTVQGEEQYTSRNLAGPVLSASDDELAPTKPLVSVEIEEAEKAVSDFQQAPEKPWYYHNVLHLLNEGFSEHEVYKKVYMAITDLQYQDALGWAKEQRQSGTSEPLPLVETPEVEEDLEELAGTAKKAHRTKRPLKYDADAVMADLKSGMKVVDVANTHNVSLPTIYKIKRQMETSRKS